MRYVKWIVMLTFFLLTMNYFAGESAAADINDSFENDPTVQWDLLGSPGSYGIPASPTKVAIDKTNHAIQLTPALRNKNGTIWLKQNLTAPFSANFRFHFQTLGTGRTVWS